MANDSTKNQLLELQGKWLSLEIKLDPKKVGNSQIKEIIENCAIISTRHMVDPGGCEGAGDVFSTEESTIPLDLISLV